MLAGFIFLAGQLAVGLMLDLSPKIRFFQAGTISDVVAKTGRPPDILFLGSSRFMLGLDIEEIRQFMSTDFPEDAPLISKFTPAACDTFLMDFITRLMSSQGITPGMIIMEISPEVLNGGGPWLNAQITRIVTWKDLPDLRQDPVTRKEIPRLLWSRIVPAYYFRKELLDWIFDTPEAYFAVQGPAPADDPSERRSEALRLSQSSVPAVTGWFQNYQVGGINAQHLESMLTRLRDQSVSVILVAPPVSQCILSCYTPEINQRFSNYTKYLMSAYGCSFVDFRYRVPNEFFIDSQHLDSKTGKVLFSRMLAREVLHDAWKRSTRSREDASQLANHPPLFPATNP
jgi:hypothetical protein